MEMNENYINQLFESARNETPELSFDKTKAAFLTTVITLPSVVLATKPFLKWITAKFWFIIASLSLVTAGTIAIISSNTETFKTDQPINNNNGLPIKSAEDSVKTIDTIGETIQFPPLIPLAFVRTEDKTKDLVKSEDNKSILEQNPVSSNVTNKKQNVKTGIKSQDEILNRERVFTISPKTSKAELDSIKALADSANLSFFIKREDNKGVLAKFEIHLEQKGDIPQNMLIISYNLPTDSALIVTLGWLESANSEFISFINQDFSIFDGFPLEITPIDKPQIDLDNKSQSEPAYHEKVMFKILATTTKQELEAIKESAAKDGIKFEYTAKYFNKKIIKLNIQMKYGKSNSNVSGTASVISGMDQDDEIIVEWFKDESGQIVSVKIR